MKSSLAIAGAGNFGREIAAYLGARTRFIEGEWIENYTPPPGEKVIVAIASPSGRERVYNLLVKRGAALTGMRDQQAYMLARGEGGVHAIALPFCFVSCAVSLGLAAIINTHTSIGHDCQIGDFCTFASHVALGGHVTVGDRVEFGTGCIVTPGVKIGNDAFIGAGAVVVKDVAAGDRIFGNPGRVFGTAEPRRSYDLSSPR